MNFGTIPFLAEEVVDTIHYGQVTAPLSVSCIGVLYSSCFRAFRWYLVLVPTFCLILDHPMMRDLGLQCFASFH